MAVKMDPAILLHPDGTLEVLEVSIVDCPDDDPHRLPGSEGESVVSFVQKQSEKPDEPS